jgi:hypothetical protein
VYWSSVSFEIGDSFVSGGDPVKLATHYLGVLERFVRGLGDEGRFAIKQLVVKDTKAPMCASSSAYDAFQQVVRYIPDCASLTVLRLEIAAHVIFRDEENALEDFLYHGRPLQSKGLATLDQMLKAIPTLQKATTTPNEVDHKGHPKLNWCDVKELSALMQFTFTSLDAKNQLWIEVQNVCRRAMRSRWIFRALSRRRRANGNSFG